MSSMKNFDVYVELLADSLTPEQLKKVIKSRWVFRWKGDEIRARLCAKGYSQDITNMDTFASTPLLLTLKILLLVALARGWKILFGDVSTAFLHALLGEDEEIMVEPPSEYYSPHGPKVIWRLRRPLYGLKTAPKQWQDHFANILTDLGGRRLKSEPNVYYFANSENYVLVYVDDVVVPGRDPQPLFDKIKDKVLLKFTGELTEGGKYSFPR